MSMISTFKRSWQLLGTSLQVMRQHKPLLVFPLISFSAILIMLFFFMIPAIWTSSTGGLQFFTFDDAPGRHHGEMNLTLLGYGCAAILYFAAMFLATFCNVAFYSQILQALSGEAASVRAGFAFALGRMPQILAWSLFAGTIGLIIKTLEQRLGLIGRLVMRVIGMVWSVASSFAIPVIVNEDSCNPVRILQNSAQTIKKTWGELLVGYVGIQLGGLIGLIIILPLFAGMYLYATVFRDSLSPVIIFTGLGLWFALIIALSYFLGIANDIYRCALYLFAARGTVAASFTPEQLNSAWKTKKQK